jgi:hypothetical protein
MKTSDRILEDALLSDDEAELLWLHMAAHLGVIVDNGIH